MKTVLHLGAHRTGSTSFQQYMRDHSAVLTAQGIGFWGPLRLRRKILHGVVPGPFLEAPEQAFARAQGRIAMNQARSRNRGCETLIVSDENMLGSMRENVAGQILYPDAYNRLAQYYLAFGGKLSGIHLSIRSLDSYWPSLISFCLPRGMRVPSPKRMTKIAEQRRNWRDVISDISTAAPGVPITVSTFERCAGRPDAVLATMTGETVPRQPDSIWRNARPKAKDILNLPLDAAELTRLATHMHNGKWSPFDDATRDILRERYADDLFWLTSGADGRATLIEQQRQARRFGGKAEKHLRQTEHDRGYGDDSQRRLESARGERAARAGSG